MKWQEIFKKQAEVIVKHGQGKLELNVGPSGTDKTDIRITCGKTYRFLIDRFDIDED